MDNKSFNQQNSNTNFQEKANSPKSNNKLLNVIVTVVAIVAYIFVLLYKLVRYILIKLFELLKGLIFRIVYLFQKIFYDSKSSHYASSFSSEKIRSKANSIFSNIFTLILIPLVLIYKGITNFVEWISNLINEHVSLKYHRIVTVSCYIAIIALIIGGGSMFLGEDRSSNFSSYNDDDGDEILSNNKVEYQKHPNEWGSDFNISSTGIYNPDGSIDYATESKYSQPSSHSSSSSSKKTGHVSQYKLEHQLDREAASYERYRKNPSVTSRLNYESNKRLSKTMQDAYDGKIH